MGILRPPLITAEAIEAKNNKTRKQQDMDNADASVKSLRGVPPAHYTLKLTSFSLFLDAGIENFESGVFEADGYKWKLCIHPNGNKKMNVKGHISCYLVIADTKTLPPGWEVNVNFKFFVYDQIRDKYLTIQDAEGGIRRFHKMKTEWGFDELLPLETFNDAANGYLIDDCCVFGAEVFIIKSTGKGESVSMVKDPVDNIYTWTIVKFSATKEDLILSEEFDVGGHKWRLVSYPKGFASSKGKSLSLYLMSTDSKNLPSDRKVYAKCKLRIWDDAHINHIEKEVDHWFGHLSLIRGSQDFMALSELNDGPKGFMVNDVVTVEAQFMFISSFKDF